MKLSFKVLLLLAPFLAFFATSCGESEEGQESPKPTASPAEVPQPADPEPPPQPPQLYEVRVREHPDLRDSARDNRSVPLKVYYPEGREPFPLVILSHGGGGSWDAFQQLAEYLARHGYVAVCTEHVCSNGAWWRAEGMKRMRSLLREAGGLRGTTKEERREIMKKAFWDALHRMTTNPEAVLQRPRDVRFAIDQALAWNREEGPLQGRVASDAIAALGHSFGAYTTLVVCGARPALDYLEPPVGPGSGLGLDLSDDRVTIGLAMSPQSPRGVFFNRDSYESIDRPLLCFSGSEDTEKGAGADMLSAEGRKEAFDLMPPGDKHLVWLENADHMAFTFAPPEHVGNELLPSEAREDTQRITRELVLAFCDYHLKGDAAAQDKLTAEYANTLCGEVVTEVSWFRK